MPLIIPKTLPAYNVLYEDFFIDLHREDINSLNNKHIVTTSFNPVNTDMCTTARTFSRKNTG